MGKLRDHVLNNIPRCLAAVETTPVSFIEDRGAESIAFQLRSAIGGKSGQILGYDLRDYNADYDGPSEFISPLAIKWPDAPLLIVFDSNVHGYHGEMESAAKLRGDGEPKLFLCPNCGAQIFKVSVQFDYFDACYDLWDDEPEIAIENYFENIIVAGE